MKLARVATHLALLGVPRHLRASVQGDLLETEGGARDALAIALHFQADVYRAGATRRSVALLMFAAAAVLWSVPMAAQSLLEQAGVVGGRFSRAALLLWSAPALVSAVACGLLVGRSSLLSSHADAARLHLMLFLTPLAALTAPDAMQAIAAAVLMPVSAWLAHQSRRAATSQAD